MKPPDNSSRPSADVWLEYAKSDLAVARYVAQSDQIVPAKGTFHSQQAAELALKALLIYLKMEYPLTHNLSDLLNLIEQTVKVPDAVWSAASLTEYAVDRRYPLGIDVTREELEDSIRQAEKVVEWVVEKMREAKS